MLVRGFLKSTNMHEYSFNHFKLEVDVFIAQSFHRRLWIVTLSADSFMSQYWFSVWLETWTKLAMSMKTLKMKSYVVGYLF